MFDSAQFTIGFAKQVDFILVRVAPKIELRFFAFKQCFFHVFSNHEIFEDCSAQSAFLQLFPVENVQQIAQQPRVAEIDFRRFDDSFRKILIVRRQAKKYKTGFKNRNPGVSRYDGYSRVFGKRGYVQKGTDYS